MEQLEPVVPMIGDMVYYKLGNDSNRHDELRPALIVRVWSEYTVNLLVFLDGDNDQFIGRDGWQKVPGHILWKTSVPRVDDFEEAPGNSWSFPEIPLEPIEIIG